jgi:plastocyanin
MTSITHPSRPARILYSLLGLTFLCLWTVLTSTAPAQSAQTSVVTLSLSRFSKVQQLDAGPYAGLSPGKLVIHVGDSVVFSNVDTRHHTATAIPDQTSFPSGTPPWTDQELKASGKIGSGEWSTGDLAPGQRSAPIVATKPGTYLYGCFYDYSAGMRGEIVVEP